MTLGILGGIAGIVMDGPTGEKPSWLSLCGIDMIKPSASAPAIPQRALQYWPETIQDSIEVGWNFTEIPGASHALGQWGSNGGRTITLTAVLSRNMKPVNSRSLLEKVLDPFGLTKPEDDPGRNADVAAGIRYLRAFCYPYYKQNTATKAVEAYPLPICLINAPGLEWSEDGSDTIATVMTGCDVTYQLCFPDGTPRLAEVSLTLRQVVQLPGKGQLYVGRQGGTGIPGVQSLAMDMNNLGDGKWNGAGHAPDKMKGY